MPYLAVDDFKYGMDRRRERISGIPGTLWDAANIVITRGGDIRRAKSFAKIFDLPAGTVGIASIKEQLITFGGGTQPAGMPAQVRYQRLEPPTSTDMIALLDFQEFDSKVYAIAEYDDGNIYHFYDGSRVTSWDTIADAAETNFTLLAEYLALKVSAETNVSAISVGESVVISSDTPGVPFTISSSTQDNGGTNDQIILLASSQANVAEVAEVRATAKVTILSGFESSANVITSVTVNGVELLNNSVRWSGSNENTAALVAASINAGTGTHGHTATAAASDINIGAPVGAGASANGDPVAVSTAAGSSIVTSTVVFSGGVTYVAPVAQVVTATITGTFEPTDQFTLTVNGTNYRATPRGAAMGTAAYVKNSRVYSAAGSILRYCALNDPTTWVPPGSPDQTSAGFIPVTSQTSSSSRIIGIADFDGRSAVFMEDLIAVYSLNANTNNDFLVRVLPNIGTRSPESIIAFSANDVFFLDNSGVRSIRTRSLDGTTRTDDVGTVIDDAIKAFIASNPEDITISAQGVIEPDDDLFMLLIGNRLWTFSQFPSVDIAAWTYIGVPFDPTDMVRTPRRLYVRDASAIYLYGGASGSVFGEEGEAQPFAATPFLSAEDQAGTKRITGFDIACTGEWQVEMLIDPNDETKKVPLGIYHKTTYAEPDVGTIGESTHFALEFTCLSAGDAKLSSFAVHYETIEQR